MAKQETILIVEDEDALRNLLKIMLEENDLKVMTAADGVEAVEIFKNHKDEIGILLSDLGLPRLGGWEAFLIMREINPELKGILASGFFDKKVKAEIIKSGAKTFVEKPYDLPAIISMIRDMLSDNK